jgi:hypothetical protein
MAQSSALKKFATSPPTSFDPRGIPKLLLDEKPIPFHFLIPFQSWPRRNGKESRRWWDQHRPGKVCFSTPAFLAAK